MPGEGSGEPPLLGPGGRIPSLLAVPPVAEPGNTSLRKGWLPRHTVVMVVAGPLLFLTYRAAYSGGPADLTVNLLLAAMAVVAALILATYLPLRGAKRAPGAACSALAGLLVPGAAVLLHQATDPFGGALALGVLGLGLWQRLSGTSTCS